MDARRPEFRWLEQGAGEPVLLLHGLMGQMHHWDPVIEGLAPRYRPIALTMPILDAALADVSVGGLTAHVLRFLDALDIPRVIVGGNSLGGLVGLTFAMAHSDRVSGLILSGSPGLPERATARRSWRRPSREYVRRKMEEAVFDPSLITETWVESMRAIMATPASALRVLRLARDARRHNVEHGLGAIGVPTLLIWGREDRITSPELAERFHALIPDAQLVLLARCGHTSMLERPVAFTDAAADWLETTRERRAGFVPTLLREPGPVKTERHASG